MIMKFNNFKFVMGVIISVLFIGGYIVSAIYNGANSEISISIICMSVCLILLTPTAKFTQSILKRAYGYKFQWFNAPDIELIEMGKISRNTAYVIGKEKTESFPKSSKFIMIFADDNRKKDVLIKQYNKTFTDSNLAEVSEYLDSFAEYWKYSNSIRGRIKEISKLKQIS